jgi:sulfate permease, SulP family
MIFSARPRLFAALRERFSKPYSINDLGSDLMAGIIVGLVAIPLAMALAVATGVPPQHGLYTAVFGGLIVALLGGSCTQITGPTAAFVVILAPVVQSFGLAGLLVAGLMAGLILMAMGLLGLGRLIEFVPHPVTTGFTSGIALVIISIQLRDFFGLTPGLLNVHFFERLHDYWLARGSWSPVEFGIGMLTLFLLIAWKQVTQRVPAPLIAIALVTILTYWLNQNGYEIATINSRYAGIPQVLPSFSFPWSAPGQGGEALVLNWDMIQRLLPFAFAIAMLGSIESLLSAVVADGMAQTKHDPDAELFALGIGNVLCPFLGGIPGTGAISRTATNVRFGARSPVAAITHALFVLLVIAFFPKAVSQLPMAAMAALLIFVAWHMAEFHNFKSILKVAPRSDALVLLICFSLTVAFDMVIGVSVGVVLASLLFMKRMAASTTSTAILSSGPPHPRLHMKEPLPKEIMLYEIMGPLFFGTAERAIEEVNSASPDIRVVIFLLNDVPVMDVSGLKCLQSSIDYLNKHRRLVILSGLRPQPASLLQKAGLLKKSEGVRVCSNLEDALQVAHEELASGRLKGLRLPGRAF